MQYPQNVKILGDSEIKFPGLQGTVKAKIHRDLPEGKLRTVTVSKTPDGRYYASLLMDGTEKPEITSEGKAVGIDLGLVDFAVTSKRSKTQGWQRF